MDNDNKFEEYEISYLDDVKSSIKEAIEEIDSTLLHNNDILNEQKRYIWDNIYEMDTVEKASNVDIIVEQEGNIYRGEQEKFSLLRLLQSPYFGRIDFSYDDDPPEDAERFYIGIRGFTPKDGFEPMVYDWRAPISSMFYDSDEGPASYKAPQGVFDGIIRKKRQYKIENGTLKYIVDSSLKIDDDILQETLSHSTDNKMKNIVSTIQREQNEIIRDNTSDVLIVQGCAGSGKTSIALHRLAYILYAFRDEIKSNEMLVVSPNHVFSDYISNVLPELGETNINEMSFDDMIREELKNIGKVEDRLNSIEKIINNVDENSDFIKNHHYKNSARFLEAMVDFITNFGEKYISFNSISSDGLEIDSNYIKNNYNREYIKKLPIFSRFDEIVNLFIEEKEIEHGTKISNKTIKNLKDLIKNACINKTDVVEIYNDFISSHNSLCDFNLETVSKKEISYEDALPLIYMKFELVGYTAFHRIKHVVVDEMQDYSQVHFEILKRIFPCKMTILGDINQVIEKRSKNVLDDLKTVFKDGKIITINKTYRSTVEITNFANSIIGLKSVIPFERHGDSPKVCLAKDFSDEYTMIVNKIAELKATGKNNIAIICKNEKHAKKLFDDIHSKDKIILFTKDATHFEGGTVIITSYLAKGLEFDSVIIPDVSEDMYNTPIDAQILYIASSRALHNLSLYYTGNKSNLIPKEE